MKYECKYCHTKLEDTIYKDFYNANTCRKCHSEQRDKKEDSSFKYYEW
jgi:hypothetical protein